MIPILLTATVNPHGMKGASFSVEERARMYAEAVAFYLQKLPAAHSIVFAENSGSIESVKTKVDDIRVEWLDVSNADYDINRGKGYNETILISQAVTKSKCIAQSRCFFKITGRLKLLNINSMLKECSRDNKLRFIADCKDHGVYDFLHLPINGHAGECRYWFATVSFFRAEMFPMLDCMNDYTNPPFLAEDAMLSVCRKVRNHAHCKDRFKAQAFISGKGGHSLGNGLSFFYSTDNDSAILRFKSGFRQLLRWMMPFWKC